VLDTRPATRHAGFHSSAVSIDSRVSWSVCAYTLLALADGNLPCQPSVLQSAQMDAHAHLLSLGWAGPGHSLDSRPHKGRRGLAYDPKQVHNTGNGLIKPLLISQKKNTFGIGKKAHEPAAGNEWWLKGFETALSNVGKSESERTSGTATPELGRPANGYVGKHMGLYGFFVKGGEMEGTIGLDAPKELTLRRKKRKSDGLDNNEGLPNSSDGEKRSPETRKKRKSKEGTDEFEQVGAFLQARDKDDKRRLRKQKASPFEEFQQVGEFFEARSSRRKASTSVNPHTGTLKPAADVTAEVSDVGDEERRRRRKERKAAKMAKALEAQATSDAEIAPTQTTTNAKDDQRKEENAGEAPGEIEKAVQKTEKTRRKKLERK
jgi:nucleolar protein TMA23